MSVMVSAENLSFLFPIDNVQGPIKSTATSCHGNNVADTDRISLLPFHRFPAIWDDRSAS
eukprot:CAMPEP_0178770690 /NCGR_PEP_ID=MMETSP0744-20121128/21540_1 /TAXON_ID=913974 /ORGANISM="Nitzschia punctata, Strain CCMP561" /LENGTH=59 /DNA_ID=CAMNT_0020427111 /DNA_START=700 /DNA_END=879 /DNA_ORIENTATION=-